MIKPLKIIKIVRRIKKNVNDKEECQGHTQNPAIFCCTSKLFKYFANASAFVNEKVMFFFK